MSLRGKISGVLQILENAIENKISGVLQILINAFDKKISGVLQIFKNVIEMKISGVLQTLVFKYIFIKSGVLWLSALQESLVDFQLKS